MKLIETWLYHGRVIYLTEIEGKYQLFYRSSGKATRLNTRGEIFPHALLKDGEYSPDGLGTWNAFGWIPKVYVYDGKFQGYQYKIENEFPENMKAYREILKTIDIGHVEEEEDPRVINAFCKYFIKTKEDYVDRETIEIRAV